MKANAVRFALALLAGATAVSCAGTDDDGLGGLGGAVIAGSNGGTRLDAATTAPTAPGSAGATGTTPGPAPTPNPTPTPTPNPNPTPTPTPNPNPTPAQDAGAGGRGGGGRRDAGGAPGTPQDTAPTPPPSTDPGTAGACSVTIAGGSGKEANGKIPVCCVPPSADKALIDQVFVLLNEHRKAKGVPALVYDSKLEQAIQGHTVHMAAHPFFSHDAPESAITLPWTRASMCGTSANGENIAQGQKTAEAVMNSWKNSAGHNANMLNASFKRVGIGETNLYWGQIFGQ